MRNRKADPYRCPALGAFKGPLPSSPLLSSPLRPRERLCAPRARTACHGVALWPVWSAPPPPARASLPREGRSPCAHCVHRVHGIHPALRNPPAGAQVMDESHVHTYRDYHVESTVYSEGGSHSDRASSSDPLVGSAPTPHKGPSSPFKGPSSPVKAPSSLFKGPSNDSFHALSVSSFDTPPKAPEPALPSPDPDPPTAASPIWGTSPPGQPLRSPCAGHLEDEDPTRVLQEMQDADLREAVAVLLRRCAPHYYTGYQGYPIGY